MLGATQFWIPGGPFGPKLLAERSRTSTHPTELVLGGSRVVLV